MDAFAHDADVILGYSGLEETRLSFIEDILDRMEAERLQPAFDILRQVKIAYQNFACSTAHAHISLTLY